MSTQFSLFFSENSKEKTYIFFFIFVSFQKPGSSWSLLVFLGCKSACSYEGSFNLLKAPLSSCANLVCFIALSPAFDFSTLARGDISYSIVHRLLVFRSHFSCSSNARFSANSGCYSRKMNCFPCFSSQKSKKETNKRDHDSSFDELIQPRVPGMPCALLFFFFFFSFQPWILFNLFVT